ncbi:uncharacterized protein LOC116804856 [Drosophila mojavensis]|uniref:uncharacterized protein LOC116804856 n=1 Tax=Drosophila mojavensis TaxID=7230 RepID=UPI001CD168D0|nr:uncharacterized protein LOC116804856 [Drosophila mojavensis]
MALTTQAFVIAGAKWMPPISGPQCDKCHNWPFIIITSGAEEQLTRLQQHFVLLSINRRRSQIERKERLANVLPGIGICNLIICNDKHPACHPASSQPSSYNIFV